jgi:hypothetical protein
LTFCQEHFILRKDKPGQYLIKSYRITVEQVYRPLPHRADDEFMQRDEHVWCPEREQLGDDRKVMQQDERAVE